MGFTKRERIIALNGLADAVRRENTITFGAACQLLEISPSTLYGYILLFNEIFEDVKYQDGRFERVKKVEKVKP